METFLGTIQNMDLRRKKYVHCFYPSICKLNSLRRNFGARWIWTRDLGILALPISLSREARVGHGDGRFLGEREREIEIDGNSGMKWNE